MEGFKLDGKIEDGQDFERPVDGLVGFGKSPESNEGPLVEERRNLDGLIDPLVKELSSFNGDEQLIVLSDAKNVLQGIWLNRINESYGIFLRHLSNYLELTRGSDGQSDLESVVKSLENEYGSDSVHVFRSFIK